MSRAVECQQIHTHEVSSDGGCRGDRQRTCVGRHIGRPQRATEGDVRSPLSGCGNALAAPDNLAAGDDQAEVIAARLHELLHERTVTSKPGPPAKSFEATFELGDIAAEHDVAAPTSEARLHNERRLELRCASTRANPRRVWVRNAGDV